MASQGCGPGGGLELAPRTRYIGSHLPHLMALALAQVDDNGGALALSLAASSFADATTRVTGTRGLELSDKTGQPDGSAAISSQGEVSPGVVGGAPGGSPCVQYFAWYPTPPSSTRLPAT